MIKLIYRLFFLTAVAILCAGDIASAQDASTLITVRDASGVEGISGVVLLVNPGDSRKSQAVVTNAQGETTVHDLQCQICTISAFDPRGLFLSRTTEFSSSSSSVSLLMQLRPLIEVVGDPNAVSIELVINDPKGQQLVKQSVVIRPTVLTLENNRLSVQETDSKGWVNVHLRAGDYTVGALDDNTVWEGRFVIANTKEQCSSIASCIVTSPAASRRLKPIRLRLSASRQ